jgi:hypothetical protein
VRGAEVNGSPVTAQGTGKYFTLNAFETEFLDSGLWNVTKALVHSIGVIRKV